MTDPQSFPTEVLLALNRQAIAARLLSGAVHEVNNALMIISGSVEMLERPPLPDTVTPALDRVQKQTARAAHALTDVLLFARGSSQVREPLNLKEVTGHSVALRRFIGSRSGLPVTTTGDSAARWTVVGQRAQLQQAFLNLLINAEQAAAGTGDPVRVEMLAEQSRVGVRVVDSGPGIETSRRDRIFEPFFSSLPPSEGGGLGLWAARAIAEAHGGSLVLEDHAPGAAFVLWLPRAQQGH